MTARTGMADLILQLRSMSDAGTADYTIAGVTYWTDDQLQTTLDLNRRDIIREYLTSIHTELGGGSIAFYDYRSRFQHLESGTAVFLVKDTTGTTSGTANWSADYNRGLITFIADQVGTAYTLTARSYNLNGAAADVWRQKAAQTSKLYSFQAGGQSFTRAQWHTNCIEMANEYDQLSLPTQISITRGDEINYGPVE